MNIIIGVGVAVGTVYLVQKCCFGKKIEIKGGVPRVQDTTNEASAKAPTFLMARKAVQKTEITEKEHLARSVELEKIVQRTNIQEEMEANEFISRHSLNDI